MPFELLVMYVCGLSGLFHKFKDSLVTLKCFNVLALFVKEGKFRIDLSGMPTHVKWVSNNKSDNVR